MPARSCMPPILDLLIDSSAGRTTAAGSGAGHS